MVYGKYTKNVFNNDNINVFEFLQPKHGHSVSYIISIEMNYFSCMCFLYMYETLALGIKASFDAILRAMKFKNKVYEETRAKI